MLDHRLRSVKERALGPLARACVGRVSATAASVAGFVLCVAAGGFAWAEQPALAVASWLAGRTLDGLDGAIARADGSSSDLGGYTDLVFDTIGYAVVPLGIAAAADDLSTWRIVAVLVGLFYVNSVSWLMLSALLEKRSAGARQRGERTSVTMPTGLVEGTETIVLFAVALAVPTIAAPVFAVMAIGVAIGVYQRGRAARRLLI